MTLIPDTLARVDRTVGQELERQVRNHHRRRLRKLGHAHVLEQLADGRPGTLWAAGEPPPRGGNELEVLIDGERAIGEICAALKAARSRVHLAGWHVTPGFEIERDGGDPRTLRELLAELAERVDVRVLVWAGPPAPVFEPKRSDVKQIRDELTDGTQIRCVLDARERTMHCHHEKLVVVDDEVAFVGGIDLTSLSGDRWDHDDHPARGRLGWHDVATRLRGPVVADVAEHFRQRWQEVASEPLPPPAPQPPHGATTVQVLRTIPDGTYDFIPRGDFRILDAYVRALKSAQRLVYLENQFLWSTEIAEILAAKLSDPPHPDFRLVLLLPARPNNGADTTRGQLGRLIEAADGSERLLAATISCRSGTQTHPLYVHAKVGIVDDRWLTIGSANLNEHSLFNDTEMNVLTCDEALARRTRLELWAEHLELPVEQVSGSPARVVDELWRPIAQDQLRLHRAELPRTHRLMELPAVSRRTKRLIGPMRGLLVDG
ncbi:MAG TPA: phospholipase D family protein [Conexibacter sp.]|nr:phospholipase D family protein [Conexibacter sp.]